MSGPEQDLRPSSTAAKMAEGLRAGVSARLDWFEAAPRDADVARLDELGDLERAAAAARPTAFAPVVRTVRRVMRLLLRPVTAAQTSFNREMARHVVNAANATRELERRLADVEDAVRALEHRLKSLEDARDSGDVPSPVRTPGAFDAATVKWLFVQSRLPPPPARVLILGSTAIAGELGLLGFHAVAVGTRLFADEPPAPMSCLADAARLPFVTGAFAAVLLLSDEEHAIDGWDSITAEIAGELARVLHSGGRLLVTAPLPARALEAAGSFTRIDLVTAGELDALEAGEDQPATSTTRTLAAVFVRTGPDAPAG